MVAVWEDGVREDVTELCRFKTNDETVAEIDDNGLVTGEDGRAVLEILFAAYQSAATGCKVEIPFHTDATKPYDLWAN